MSFTLAVWLIDGATGARARLLPALLSAFGVGWCFGFGYFLAGLWWIGTAFLVDADSFAWLMPFAVIGLPVLLAFFPALAFALARALWPAGAGRLFSFAATMAATEWLRGHVFTGFPWNAYGYALAGEIHLAQILSVIGLPGLTLVTVVDPGQPGASRRRRRRGSRWSRRVPVLALRRPRRDGGLRLRLRLAGDRNRHGARRAAAHHAAGDVQQDDKFRPEMRDEVLKRYLDLSDRATGPDTPGLDGCHAADLAGIGLPLPRLARTPTRSPTSPSCCRRARRLITGAGRAEDAAPDPDELRYFNSVHVIDSERLDPRHLRQGASRARSASICRFRHVLERARPPGR